LRTAQKESTVRLRRLKGCVFVDDWDRLGWNTTLPFGFRTRHELTENEHARLAATTQYTYGLAQELQFPASQPQKRKW
jgi:hypothetical protein